MKACFYIFTSILFLSSISFTKEQVCGTGNMCISALGKCHPISDFLGNKDLTLTDNNLLYLASDSEGKIEKDGYELKIYKLSDAKLQSHNMRKSKLYFPSSCLKKMETRTDILLDKTKGIVVIVSDSNNKNANNIPDTYFIIRHNSPNTRTPYINSKTFDFSFCHDDPILFDDEIRISDLKYANNPTKPIDIDKILYGRKFGIDLFDPYSDFLSDICVTFTSETGSDVTLESRVEDYFQNISFCDDRENSHYMSYNYSETKKSFTFRCAFGFYKDQADQSSYVDIVSSELKSVVSVSNVKVIKCYKEFLNLKDIIRNYGGMICILVLIIQIVCFLMFCFKGIKPIEDKLDDLFILGKVILKNLGIPINIFGKEGLNIGKSLGKKVYLWKLVRKLGQQRKTKEQIEKKKKRLSIKENKEKEKRRKSIKNENKNSNPPNKKDKKKKKEKKETNEGLEKKGKKRKSKPKNHKKGKKEKENEENKLDIENISEKDIALDIINDNSNEKNNSNENNPIIENDAKTNNTDKITKTSKMSPLPNDKLINTTAESQNKLKEEEEKKKKEEEEKKKKEEEEKKKKEEEEKREKEEKNKQIYEFESDELNELPFDQAIEHDKRSFCRYYGNILFFSHIILMVFFRHRDFNLFTVKLGLLFMTFPINLTMNIFFFTNESIKVSYLKSAKNLSSVWTQLDNTIYSSLLSSIILIMLKLICLTHNSVRQLRKVRDVDAAQEQSVCILRCIKVRIVIYYILSFAFLLVFGFYVLCFCAIFENTQIALIRSTLTSWLISFIYPLIICLFTSIVRSAAFKCKSKCLYFVKTMMQFL